MRRRHDYESLAHGFEEPSLIPLADMLTNTVGIIVFIMIFTVLCAGGEEVLKHLPEEIRSDARPRYYICSNGRIYCLDESLIDACQRDRIADLRAANSLKDLVGRSWSHSNRSIDVVLHFERTMVSKPPLQPIGRIHLFAEVVLRPAGGQSLWEMEGLNSEFEHDLANASSNNEYVMFWLKPDSLGVFHAARAAAIKRGFKVGWAPKSLDAPITFEFGSSEDDEMPNPQQFTN